MNRFWRTVRYIVLLPVRIVLTTLLVLYVIGGLSVALIIEDFSSEASE